MAETGLQANPTVPPPTEGQAAFVSAIQRFSLDDGPGIRTTVFLGGCPFFCPWCHNPEARQGPPGRLLDYRMLCTNCGRCVMVCPTGALVITEGQRQLRRERCSGCGRCVTVCPNGALDWSGRWMSLGRILAILREDRDFHGTDGGLTLSGGEPFEQADFVRVLAAACRAEGIGVVLDTTLDVSAQTLGPLQGLIDLWHVDIKGASPAAVLRKTGVRLERVLARLDQLLASREAVVLRVPVVPGVTAGAAFARRLVSLLGPRLARVRRLDLLPHHRLGEGKRLALGEAGTDFTSPDDTELEAMAAGLRAAGCPTAIVRH